MSDKCLVCVFTAAHEHFPPGTAHCPDCHVTWPERSEICHCVQCHRSFGSDKAFIIHQSWVDELVCHDPATRLDKHRQPRLKLVQRKYGPVWVRWFDEEIRGRGNGLASQHQGPSSQGLDHPELALVGASETPGDSL